MNILRIKDVTKKTSLCRSQIYQMMEDRAFPQSIKLGARSVGWVDTEIDKWITERMAARNEGDNEQTTTVY